MLVVVPIAIFVLYCMTLFVMLITTHFKKQRKLLFYDEFPPISVVIPAYNEENTILQTVKSILNQDYIKHEIIIVNDGSTDKTLTLLLNSFDFNQSIQHKSQEIFETEDPSHIVLINKQNEGKAASLNVGIKISRYSLICTIDADTILEKNSLRKLAHSFKNHQNSVEVVIAAGNVSVGNRELTKTSSSFFKKLMIGAQNVEYLRIFGCERKFWSLLNGVLIVSGSFVLYKKEILERLGGFRKIAGEDLDLIVRLYKSCWNDRYRIEFVKDAICWTQVPDGLGDYFKQRIRWHQGLLIQFSTLVFLLKNFNNNSLRFFSIPYFILFRILSPLFVVVCLAASLVDLSYLYLHFIGFMFVSFLINTIFCFLEYRSFYNANMVNRFFFVIAALFEPFLSLLILVYQFNSIFNIISSREEFYRWETFKRLA